MCCKYCTGTKNNKNQNKNKNGTNPKNKPKTKPVTRQANKKSRVVDNDPLCLRKLKLGYVNPFDHDTDGVCFPAWPVQDSQKLRVFARGTAVIGTAGVGFVSALSPKCYADSGTSTPNVSHSEAGYTGTTNEISGIGIANVATNSPWSQSDFDANILEGRSVAMGIRCKYVGTELNRGGVIVAVEAPHHHSLAGLTIAGLGSFDRAEQMDFNRLWTGVTWQPLTVSETEYSANGHFTGAYNPVCVMMFTGVPGETVSWEFVQHFEVIGSLARGKTANPTYQSAAHLITGLASHITSANMKAVMNGLMTVGELYRRASVSTGQRRVMY